MTRVFLLAILYFWGSVCGGDVAWAHSDNPLSLTYLGRVELRDHGQGPKEPSGVTWGPSVNGELQLWVVSDDLKMLYVFVEDDHRESHLTFSLARQQSLPVKGLEGITMNSLQQAVMVKEETNTLVRVHQDTFHELEKVRLSHMAGFDQLAEHFSESRNNKGLEGITWNPVSETFFVVKEGRPPMLLEIQRDLQAILGHWILHTKNRFFVPGVTQERLDLSGICYDRHRDKLWLVSDKGQHLFLYTIILMSWNNGFLSGIEQERKRLEPIGRLLKPKG